jgi:hypothetical protein
VGSVVPTDISVANSRSPLIFACIAEIRSSARE